MLTGSGNSSIRLFLTLRYRKLVHSENRAGKEDSLLWESARLYTKKDSMSAGQGTGFRGFCMGKPTAPTRA